MRQLILASAVIMLAVTYVQAQENQAELIVERYLKLPIPETDMMGVARQARRGTLSGLKPMPEEAFRVIKKVLPTLPNWIQRKELAGFIGSNVHTEASAKWLFELLDDPHYLVRSSAISSLGRMARRIDTQGSQRTVVSEIYEPKVEGLVPYLIKGARDVSELNRRHALYGLANARDPAAQAELRNRLTDDSEMVRTYAAGFLTEYQDASGMVQMRKSLERLRQGFSEEFWDEEIYYYWEAEILMVSFERITGKSFGPVPMNPSLSSHTEQIEQLRQQYRALLGTWSAWWAWEPVEIGDPPSEAKGVREITSEEKVDEEDLLDNLKTKLTEHPGGQWEQKKNPFGYDALILEEPPASLESGIYYIFPFTYDKAGRAKVYEYLSICAAPFYVLGWNDDCTVITYVPLDHPMTQQIIEVLDLLPQYQEPDRRMSKHIATMIETDKELNSRWDVPEMFLSETPTDQLLLHYLRSPMTTMTGLYNKIETGIQRLLNSSGTLREFYRRDDLAKGALKMYREYDLSPESVVDYDVVIAHDYLERSLLSRDKDAKSNSGIRIRLAPAMSAEKKIAVLGMDIYQADRIMVSPQFFPKTKGYEREFLAVLLERHETIIELGEKYGLSVYGAASSHLRRFCLTLAKNLDDSLYQTLNGLDYFDEQKEFFGVIEKYLNK